jgi:lipoprotein-anchoring transpeptidase ErfK/SrfK
MFTNRVFFLCICFSAFFYLKGNGQSKILPWTSYPDRVQQIDSLISNADIYALNPKDYPTTYLKNVINHKYLFPSRLDSAKADSIIHETAVQFFQSFIFGNQSPKLAYQGVTIKVDKSILHSLLTQHFNNNKLATLPIILNQQSNEVIVLLKKINSIKDQINKLGKEEIEKRGKVDQDITRKMNNEIGLYKKAVNDYRWLNGVKRTYQKIILVNLPSANLRVIENNKEKLSMKVIVGKSETPSPPLTSYLNEIVINPYWSVPRNIAVREMLPNIIKDRNYLTRNRLEVLNSSYKKINPNTVRWTMIDTNKFSYYIRQQTGCDNSLGIIKLDFDSPFGIYLHDTPEKQLFDLKNRFLSHGCMRMEKPIQMAEYLLKNDKAALDSIDFKNCYKNPSTIHIPIKEKVVVLVWYNLVDIDSKGQIQLYKDVYNFN